AVNQDSEMNTHIPGKNGLCCAGLILLAATLLPSASFGHTSRTEHSQAAAESSSQIDTPISKALPNGIEIHHGKLTLQVVALGETVLRVRQSVSGVLPEDASWAVPAQIRRMNVEVTQEATADVAGFHTKA